VAFLILYFIFMPSWVMCENNPCNFVSIECYDIHHFDSVRMHRNTLTQHTCAHTHTHTCTHTPRATSPLSSQQHEPEARTEEDSEDCRDSEDACQHGVVFDVGSRREPGQYRQQSRAGSRCACANTTRQLRQPGTACACQCMQRHATTG